MNAFVQSVIAGGSEECPTRPFDASLEHSLQTMGKMARGGLLVNVRPSHAWWHEHGARIVSFTFSFFLSCAKSGFSMSSCKMFSSARAWASAQPSSQSLHSPRFMTFLSLCFLFFLFNFNFFYVFEFFQLKIYERRRPV